MDSTMDEDCPVCYGPLQNPSPPVPCCRKVFCHSCLRQAVLARPQCPYCRSPINNRAGIVFRNAVRCGIDLQGTGASPQTTRTVSPSIQVLHNQLRASSARVARANTSTPNQASVELVSNTTAQDMRFAAVRALQRPVPRPRVRAQVPNPVSIQAPNPVSIQASNPANIQAPNPVSIQASNPANIQAPNPVSIQAPNPVSIQAPNPVSIQAPNPVSIQAPNPVSIQANPSAPSYLWLNDIYDMNWQPHNPVMDNSGNILRTYNCPYCQEGGLDDLDLRDHCNEHHINDRRQVVCPVCVSLPHGNPTYCSRDFIGHLNLRHSYYIDDINNVYQSDDVNLQDAIMRSWQQK